MNECQNVMPSSILIRLCMEISNFTVITVNNEIKEL